MTRPGRWKNLAPTGDPEDCMCGSLDVDREEHWPRLAIVCPACDGAVVWIEEAE